MTLIMDAAARFALIKNLVRIVQVLDDVAGWEPALAHRVGPVRTDLARFLWFMRAPLAADQARYALDRLIDAPGWQHPRQVLGAQGVDYDGLTAECRQRLARTRGRRRRRIEGVLKKIERAHRKAEEVWTLELHQLKDRIGDLLEELPAAWVDPEALGGV